MGKSNSNSTTSNSVFVSNPIYIRPLTSPKRKGGLLNLTTSNLPLLTSSAAPPLSPKDVFYDALEEFPDHTTKDVCCNAPEELSDGTLGDVFYDTLEYFDEDLESQPPGELTLQPPVDPEPECAKKEHPALFAPTPKFPSTPSPISPSTPLFLATPTSTFTLPALSPGSPCGPSQPTTSSRVYGDFLTVPQLTRAQVGAIQLTTSAPRPRDKAVLIGLNYERGDRLRYATRDAQRFATTLRKHGFSDENVKVVTDAEGQPTPSSEYLLKWIDWLVRDASAGDRLFFMFSGHCEPPKLGSPEPYLVAADPIGIPRSTFQERLVAKIPAGAELTIVLDCCNAAGMAKLKYCIKRMQHNVPQHGSLHGLAEVDQNAPAPLLQATRATVDKVSFGTPAGQTPRRRPGGISAGQPIKQSSIAPNLVPVSSTFPSFSFSFPQPLGINRRPNMYPVAQGRPLPPLEGCKADPVSPAGKVTLWAGAGERQKAFEAAGGPSNGVFTDAICKVLDACPDGSITRRNVWDSIVESVEKENALRKEYDAKYKDLTKIAPNTRVQRPELWTSYPESPGSPSHLDQLVFQAPTM